MEEKGKYRIYPIMVDDRNLKTVNFYLVKTDLKLVLVDAGWNNEESFALLHKTLGKNGFSISDLDEIILTHNHIDHVGLVNRITEKYSIPVFAHKEAIPRLKRDPDFFQMRLEFYVSLYKEMGCGAEGDKRVAYLKKAMEKNSSQALETDILPIGKEHLGFEVIEVPGHAPDQIALFDKPRGELIGGDLLLEHISSNALVEPDYEGRRLPSLIQHKNSLENVQNLDVYRIYPGHGVVIENPHELLTKRITGIDKKAEKLKKLINQGYRTGNEIAKNFYKKSYETQFSLVMSEIIGHLDYMEANQEITKEKEDGVWHYYIVE
ncbi:MBL fold metallo-hydrolase [Oceanobacillus halophilus]|uniref:MBL fold metallo-hydrolase n=1 Tax=Oceanobacillus halophilus TaxID=930130 RepID=A0A494ZXM4_9BACI|nr:MBL fold metallo-hydrolase [Oceanobacillus halophilus]RKQ30788.1 MBL fold metallo-hydrolase [Oceanobacillus halophilus]